MGGDLKSFQLRLDGGRELVCVGHPKSQLVQDNHIRAGSRSKTECDDVGVLLLGSDLEDGGEYVSVLDPAPSSSV